MKNQNDESKKWILGLLLGGAIGACALYYIHAAQNRKVPLLKKMGKTIADVGEMLENCDSGADVVENIEKKLPSGSDILNNLTDWVDTGLTLWKKFKKG